VNRSYAAMAAHYRVGILPARPKRPRDKAAVEAGVRFAQSYILGRLRNVTFFSLAECNVAPRVRLRRPEGRRAVAVERMNSREMRRLGMSRRQLFETVERPLMQALPLDDYEYAEWHLARVGIDYHVEVQGFFYSVPHALIREQVDTRATARTIEVFHRGKRVAPHARRYGGPRHGTQPEHMPSAHRRGACPRAGLRPDPWAEWTPARFQRQARDIGPNTEALIIAVMARRPHPEQGFRTCVGVLRLFRGLDAARVERVSLRAIEVGALSYASVASILKHRLDQKAAPQAADGTPLLHDNIRGPRYYH
jgi:transposase